MTSAILESPDNPRFWQAFGVAPEEMFKGKKILEIGCGTGRRSIQLLSYGAASVTGQDIYETSITTANQRRDCLSSEEQQKISFLAKDISDLDQHDFDIILSEDAFEHVLDVPKMLSEVAAHLKPEGIAMIGFAPLYHSINGDHGWMRQTLPMNKLLRWPWGHLYFPKRYMFQRLTKLTNIQTENTKEKFPYMSLNQHTVAEFRKFFHDSPLSIDTIVTNPTYSLKGKIYDALAKIKPLEKYFTWGIYTKLKKSA